LVTVRETKQAKSPGLTLADKIFDFSPNSGLARKAWGVLDLSASTGVPAVAMDLGSVK
jgi:hypothetical protein